MSEERFITSEKLEAAIGGKYKTQLRDRLRDDLGEVIEISQMFNANKQGSIKLTHYESLQLSRFLRKALLDIERIQSMPIQMRNALVAIEDAIADQSAEKDTARNRHKLNVLEQRREEILKGIQEWQGHVSA